MWFFFVKLLYHVKFTLIMFYLKIQYFKMEVHRDHFFFQLCSYEQLNVGSVVGPLIGAQKKTKRSGHNVYARPMVIHFTTSIAMRRISVHYKVNRKVVIIGRPQNEYKNNDNASAPMVSFSGCVLRS